MKNFNMHSISQWQCRISRDIDSICNAIEYKNKMLE